MAVEFVNEVRNSRSATEGKDFLREYTRTFQVVTTNPLDDGLVAKSDPRIPRRGEIYSVPVGGGLFSVDPVAKCISVEASQGDDPQVWTVTCKYSSDQAKAIEDPTQERTKTSETTEWIESPLIYDLDDFYILNSAWDTFETPATIQVPIRVVKKKCTRISYLPSQDFFPYVKRTNSVAFLGAQIGEVLLDDLNVNDVDKNGIYYKEFDYTFKIRQDLPNPWNYKPLDMGFNRFDPITFTFKHITTRDGHPVSKPRLLNGAGELLDVENEDPFYHDFRIHHTADFNEIVFP